MAGERRLVAGLLLQPDRLTDVSLAMAAGDFHSPDHRLVFSAMCDMHLAGRPVSVETVAAHLNRDEGGQNLLSSIGGRQTIMNYLVGADPGEIDFWVDETVKFRKRRDTARVLETFASRVADAADPDKLRNEIEEALVNLADPESAEVSHISASNSTLDSRFQQYIDSPDAITGLQTGWPKWDRVLDGLREGGVTIIYAKSSRYKSMFMQNMGWRFGHSGEPGLWFTTEMPVIDVAERLVQLEAGLNFRTLRHEGRIGEFADVIRQAQAAVAALPIYMSEGFDLSTASIRAEVRRQRRWHDIKYVVVDLVDHVQTKKYANDTITQQSYIMRTMKDIAKKEHVHIILISHVAKGDKLDARAIELPVEDMKGSSSKYQDVDNSICIVPCLFGIPPERRGKDVESYWYGLIRDEISQEIFTRRQVEVMVSITKNRAGDTGRFLFTMNAAEGGRFYAHDQ